MLLLLPQFADIPFLMGLHCCFLPASLLSNDSYRPRFLWLLITSFQSLSFSPSEYTRIRRKINLLLFLFFNILSSLHLFLTLVRHVCLCARALMFWVYLCACAKCLDDGYFVRLSEVYVCAVCGFFKNLFQRYAGTSTRLDHGNCLVPLHLI